MRFTHSIFLNKILREVYKKLLLPLHIKQLLKAIYLRQPAVWKTRNMRIFPFGKNREPLPSVAVGAHQFDPNVPWALIIDFYVPTPDQGSGSGRMSAILHLLKERGLNLTFISDSEKYPADYQKTLERTDIQVFIGFDEARRHLATEGGKYHFVFLSWPEVAFRYLPYVRSYALYSKVIYDVGYLHWVRFERERWIKGNQELLEVAASFKRMELLNTASADLTLAITGEEKNRLAIELPFAKIAILPNIHETYPPKTLFTQRKAALFIGNFWHQPNEDAVIFFVKHILPKITEKIPDLVFYVIGGNMPASVASLRSTNVQPLGFVTDVVPYFESCRLFVAPLRYGGGMKGKVGQSMSHGLPVVTTQIGAEGMGLEHGKQVLIADDAEGFANSVVRLYTNEVLWQKLSAEALAHVEVNYSYIAAQKRLSDIFDAIKDERHGGEHVVDDNSSAPTSSVKIAGSARSQTEEAAGYITGLEVLTGQEMARALIAGIYLADNENLAPQISREFGSSRKWGVEQRWVSLGKSLPNTDMAALTVQKVEIPAPKFLLLNQLLKTVDLSDFEYLVISDDDILLPAGFLDSYLAFVSLHRFALAQPARTHDSYIDHRFVERLDGIDARRTRFVEIGPLFSLHRSAFKYFLPFDEASPMGWGNDFVWPVVAEKNSLRMGIVDAVPIAHSLRKPVAHYNYKAAAKAMNNYLAGKPHLSKEEAFFILESYA
jgi:glycosyltransferase involved in cell wall biosynthesis